MAAHWPQPWALLAAVAITVGGLWWPRLLGVASVLMSPYLWLYMLTPLATLLVKPVRVRNVARRSNKEGAAGRWPDRPSLRPPVWSSSTSIYGPAKWPESP
jgi:hypothetical protein